MTQRKDGRAAGQLRPVQIETGVISHAEGSAVIRMGKTEALCVASVEERVPPFLRDSGLGWVTAEYAMLPRSTIDRTPRERRGAGGRTMEIQRLIGRSLRAVTERALLGERTITVDCDIIQADGGTRCASITGACVAMYEAMRWMVEREMIARLPARDIVGAVSAGVLGGGALLDLDYEEDSAAEVDMNVVMTGSGMFVELQGTAEEKPFSRERMNTMLDLAGQGLQTLFEKQRKALRLQGAS
ncbi:MAG: ribonuclease PH [Candidatus Nitrospinota bacterium M3_3B_026]